MPGAHCLKAVSHWDVMNITSQSQITQLLAAQRLLQNNVTYSSHYIKMFSVITDEWSAQAFYFLSSSLPFSHFTKWTSRVIANKENCLVGLWFSF